MIHISTDYVFDGTSPPYKVGDKCNPLSKYGLTKQESEEAVLAAAPGESQLCCRYCGYGVVKLGIVHFAYVYVASVMLIVQWFLLFLANCIVTGELITSCLLIVSLSL